MSNKCWGCGDDVDPRRWARGYRLCMPCGEKQAQAERKSWCVAQEYGKGGYQFITSERALQTLRETNQKNPR